jgi:hypothetical protein
MARKPDLRQVDRIAGQHGINTPELRHAFGKYVEKCKRLGMYGSAPDGDATVEELHQMAEEFRQGMR